MTTEVVGKALYFEFEHAMRSSRITQLIVLPSYLANSGKQYNPIYMDRTLDEYSPRSQWDFRRLNSALDPEWKDLSRAKETTDYADRVIREPSFYLNDIDSSYYTEEEQEKKDIFDSLSLNDKAKHIRAGLEHILIQSLFFVDDSNVIQAKTKFRSPLTKPLVVEVTNDDMELALEYKTPQALIRRIQKVRVAKGLPEKIVTPV